MARILIVEDEPLISMMLEDWLIEMGHEPVGPAATVDAALALVYDGVFEAAILDVNLRSQHCSPVAAALSSRRIPFAIATGDTTDVNDQFEGRPSLSKPYDFAAMKQVVDQLSSAINLAGHVGNAQGQDGPGRDGLVRGDHDSLGHGSREHGSREPGRDSDP